MLAATVLAYGITHLTDARYFAAWEVDYLAFPIGEGEGHISYSQFDAIREWIQGPKIVQEVTAEEKEEHIAADKISIALLQNTAPALAAKKEWMGKGFQLMVRTPIEGYHSTDDIVELMEPWGEGVTFVLDFEAGGITWSDLLGGHPFTVQELQVICQKMPCFLQIDLSGRQPMSVLEETKATGFAVRGSNEEKVGYKSYDDLDPLFEGLETYE